MELTALTEREKQWNRVARRAVANEEVWEACDDCLQFHPVGYDGACDNQEQRLPGQPSEFGG